jgi:hypothetical protein
MYTELRIRVSRSSVVEYYTDNVYSSSQQQRVLTILDLFRKTKIQLKNLELKFILLIWIQNLEFKKRLGLAH